MQDACKAFLATKFTTETGVQGFYDTLLDHTHNMAVYPDDYLIMETFLRGIHESLCQPIINNGLLPEVNTINDFVAQAQVVCSL
jgi:aspartate/glutamate racemase